MITVASIFRDSMSYIPRYFAQVRELELALGENVRLVIAEGDSEDNTYAALDEGMRPGDQLLKVDHGGPKYGSVDRMERWHNVAIVCNAVMEAMDPDGPVTYVESDLIWEPPTMVQLLEDLAICGAVAPMSMMKDRTPPRFYDLWGHRGLDGEKFSPNAPYHPSLVYEGDLVKIGSAGSCVVMREDVAKVARFGENDCIVGLGREIRTVAGQDLWLDRRVAVYHP